MKKLLTILLSIVFCIIANSQTVLTIQDSVTVSSNTGTIAVVSIPHTTTTTFTFKNSSITSVNAGGYMLSAGDEDPGSNNNKLDGEVITGNKFTWNGTDATAITHGIFLGYNINTVIRNNYLSKVPYGVILKSGTDAGVNMNNTSGGVAYNIIKNARTGVVVKGINNSKIYNNTFYNSLSTSIAFVYIQPNQNRTIPAASTGTQIKNNIFYSTVAKTTVQLETYADTVGFRSDYNLFYYTSGSPVFYINGVQKTFAQWQALGYDTHSVVMNPNFVDTVNFVPASRLNYGTDLGSTWQAGLATSAVWGVGNPVTTDQNGTWQVGARLYDNEYYVSPTGSDASGSGTISSPWFTLNKAWTVVVAGDVIYMRGGTYNYTSRQALSNKDGTPGNYINIWNYPGESPVINGAGWVYGIGPILIRLEHTDYIYLKGIRLTNLAQQPIANSQSCYGLMLWDDVNNSIFEQLETDHIGGWGMVFGSNCSNNLIHNLDSHHNYDPYSAIPYDGSDGFQTAATTGTGNIMRGCRFWNNSDDGIDLRGATGTLLIDSCWAWMNGYREDGVTTGGNGQGFKLGPPLSDMHSVHLRTVTNSLAFHNRESGFTSNEVGGRYVAWLYNNTAWHNADGATVYNLGFEFASAYSPPSIHILRNNVAFANQHPTNLQANYTNCLEDHNTWDGLVTVNDTDFESLDTTGVSGSRQANGSLPVLSFLKLSLGSDLINAGVDVGLPFTGSAPDMGAFELNNGCTCQ